MRDSAETMHELDLHQIELQLQNEDLRSAQIKPDMARKRYDLAPIDYCTSNTKDMII